MVSVCVCYHLQYGQMVFVKLTQRHMHMCTHTPEMRVLCARAQHDLLVTFGVVVSQITAKL